MPQVTLTDRAAAEQATSAALAALNQHRQNGTLDAAIDELAIPPPAPEQFWRVNAVAIVFWREFVKAGGLQLDPYLWHIDRGAVQALAQAVENGLRKGTSGISAAAVFLYEGCATWEFIRVNINDWMGDDETGQEFSELLDDLFTREINRSHLAAQYLSGIIDRAEFDTLLE